MDRENKSLKVNMLLNAFLRVSSMLYPLITFPYVSRILGASGMGKVTFSNSVVAYFLMFAQLGVPTYGIRACAKVKDDREKLSKNVYDLLFLEIFLSIITYIILFFCTITIHKFISNKYCIYVCSISILLNAVGMEWFYQAIEDYSYITWRSILFKAIALVLMFFCVKNPNDVLQYAFLTVVASSGSYICNVINIRKCLFPLGNFWGRIHIFAHIKPALTFFAMTVATTIYTNLDNIMLGFMTTDADVGYYTSAVKVKTFLVGAITSVGTVLLPRATVIIEHGNKNKFITLLNKTIHLIGVVSLPLTLFFITYARPTIYILSGRGYESSVIPMQLILPSVVFIGITNIIGYQALLPLNGENYMLLSVTLGAILDLIVNSIMIPNFKSSGAAIGTLAAEILVFIVQYIVVKKKYNLHIDFSTYRIPVLSSIVVTILCTLINHFIINIYISLIVGFFVFFGIYLFMLLIFKDEVAVESMKSLRNK